MQNIEESLEKAEGHVPIKCITNEPPVLVFYELLTVIALPIIT